jgi:hypothetical protein
VWWKCLKNKVKANTTYIKNCMYKCLGTMTYVTQFSGMLVASANVPGRGEIIKHAKIRQHKGTHIPKHLKELKQIK